MSPEEAKRHAAHLCDVYPVGLADGDDHIGVISEIVADDDDNVIAHVSGHPEYAGRWFDVLDIATTCRVTD